MGIRGLTRRLDGLLGRAVYRATIPVDDARALGSRLERAMRTGYEPEGFIVTVEESCGSWFLNAHRGLVAGFGVGLLQTSGPEREPAVLAGVARSSRLDGAAGWVAGGLAMTAATLTVLAVGIAGWPLAGLALAAVAFGVLVIVTVVAYQVLIPAVVMAEFLGGGRLTEEQIAAVVALVRGVIEADPEVPSRQQVAEPAAADPAGM